MNIRPDRGLNPPQAHSALGLKLRIKALSQVQAAAVLQGFERSLKPVLQAEPLGAGENPPQTTRFTCRYSSRNELKHP